MCYMDVILNDCIMKTEVVVRNSTDYVQITDLSDVSLVYYSGWLKCEL